MLLVYFQHEIVSLYAPVKIALAQQQRRDSRVEIVALLVGDYFEILVVSACEYMIEIIGHRGLAVCARDCNDRAVHLKGFEAVFVECPQLKTWGVACVLAYEIQALDHYRKVFVCHKTDRLQVAVSYAHFLRLLDF